MQTGGWEGNHLDFKLLLEDKCDSISKIIKHVLAFANTPRKSEAFIIFGVKEYKDEKKFKNEGCQCFPNADKIYNLISSYTNFPRSELVVDDSFLYHQKKTPYIAIHQAYDGPYCCLKNSIN